MTKKPFTVSAVLLLIASLTITSYGQDKGGIPGPDGPISPTKAAAIRRLLELTGSGKLGKQMVDQMFAMMKSTSSNVPSSVWDQAKAEFDTDVETGKFIDMVVPIYNRAYTEEDINELVTFYESPLGKKVVNSLPQILTESMAAGQQWGAEVLQRLKKKLKEKGYSISGE